MTRLTDAIAWSGCDVTLSLFAAFPDAVGPRDLEFAAVPEPYRFSQYDLEDLDHRLHGRSCREYDLIYESVPPSLELVIESWIAAALAVGADPAWFGFEGSFDFEHILTGDVADQIYAIGTADWTALAVDDECRGGPDWATLLRLVREELGL